jgi:hypothetical protein
VPMTGWGGFEAMRTDEELRWRDEQGGQRYSRPQRHRSAK